MALTVRINNLRLKAIVGAGDQERLSPQEVVVNVSMELTDGSAARSDDIADTVDYEALCQEITRQVEAARFSLLERLAGQVLSIVMSDRKVAGATVEVAKPGALERADSASAAVSSRRGQ
jgi:FolB domain-containing protein